MLKIGLTVFRFNNIQEPIAASQTQTLFKQVVDIALCCQFIPFCL